tara:strand:+ start:37 stop:270 length:234 start_codon:yes stop_codon:yes gene_type:complete
MKQSKERLKNLKSKYECMRDALFVNGKCILTPKKKDLFLQGFALGNFEEDIIFQMCYNFYRCPLKEVERFLIENKAL